MSFSSDIEKFNKVAMSAATKVFRGASLEILSNIIKKTPVDTGRLRGNWQTSINRIITAQTKSKAVVAFRRVKTETSKAKISDIIFMVNNLPYASTVENGTFPQGKGKTNKTVNGFSSQARQGMVKVTILEWQRLVAKNAKAAR